MSQFKVGDKVRRTRSCFDKNVVIGTVYTVAQVQTADREGGGQWLYLAEVDDTVLGSWNFEAVEPTQVDLRQLRDEIVAVELELDALRAQEEKLVEKRTELYNQLRQEGFTLCK